MRHVAATRTWVIAALLTAAAGAQEVQYVEPAERTVRGNVSVWVDLGPGYRNGFVMFYLGPSDKPLRFAKATGADDNGLFGFEWDTQGQDTKVTDGEYRVLAVGFNAAGEVIGQKTVTIEVQNEVPKSQIGDTGILLRHNLTPGREARFRGRTVVQVAPGDGAEGSDVSMFNGEVDARWRWRVLWRNPDGRAQVRNSIIAASELSARGRRQSLPAQQQFLSLLMEPIGKYVEGGSEDTTAFAYGEVTLEFPRTPVKLGDTWRSPITFVVDPRMSRLDTVTGTHTLTSIEWHAGYRCAIIDSEFEGGPYRLVLKGEDQENEEWLAGVTGIIRGKRRTYFAYQPEVGRVLRVEETQEQNCALELVEEPEQAMGGMEGMMGMEGQAGMPGMMPGMPGNVPGETLPGMVPGAGMAGEIGAGYAVEGTQQSEKPAGFDKGSMAFKRVNPKPAATMGGGMGTEMGMGGTVAQEPPKITVVHFNRNLRTDLFQDFLSRRE